MNTNYFCTARISISVAILSEILIQIGYFLRSYARKQKWVFFSDHSVVCNYFFLILNAAFAKHFCVCCLISTLLQLSPVGQATLTRLLASQF